MHYISASCVLFIDSNSVKWNPRFVHTFNKVQISIRTYWLMYIISIFALRSALGIGNLPLGEFLSVLNGQAIWKGMIMNRSWLRIHDKNHLSYEIVFRPEGRMHPKAPNYEISVLDICTKINLFVANTTQFRHKPIRHSRAFWTTSNRFQRHR